jgi:outer membrane protein assembly factor BamB
MLKAAMTPIKKISWGGCVKSSFDPVYFDMMNSLFVMKNTGSILFVFIACVALSSCSLLRTKASPPPLSSVFPLQEESRILYEGEINLLVQNSGGRLYFSTRKGFVYCIDGVKKNISWKYSARAGIAAPPCLGEGRLFFADQENGLYCLSETGQLVWEKKLREKVSGDLEQGIGKVFLNTPEGMVLAFDASTGNEAWRFGSGSAVRSGLIFWNRQIIFGTADGRLLFLGPDGRRLATVKTKAGIRGRLFIDSNRLFYSLDDDTFNSLNLISRRRRWTLRTGGYVTAPPAADDRRIYFLNSNSAFFCLAKRGGEILWWRPVPSPSYFKPEICGEEVLATTLSSLLLGFYKKTGEKSGTHDAGQELKSNPLALDSSLALNLYDREAGTGILVFLKRAGVSPVLDQKK